MRLSVPRIVDHYRISLISSDLCGLPHIEMTVDEDLLSRRHLLLRLDSQM